MNFYDFVTVENAIEWYKELPHHLKKQVDANLVQFSGGRECLRKELPEIYRQVETELGTRPGKPVEPKNPIDGWTHEQAAQFEQLKKWAARYDELVLIKVILEMAPGMQKERKLLSSALGLDKAYDGSLPSQADGLDDVQAATVRWLQNQGETPLEFLVRTYRSEDFKIGERIQAARSLLDFVHRKVPVKQEVETKDMTKPKLDAKALKGLTEKELRTLEDILSKLGDGNE